jgi:hypothetical protein
MKLSFRAKAARIRASLAYGKDISVERMMRDKAFIMQIRKNPEPGRNNIGEYNPFLYTQVAIPALVRWILGALPVSYHTPNEEEQRVFKSGLRRRRAYMRAVFGQWVPDADIKRDVERAVVTAMRLRADRNKQVYGDPKKMVAWTSDKVGKTLSNWAYASANRPPP